MKTYAAKIHLSAAGASPKRANEIKICATLPERGGEKPKNCCKKVKFCSSKQGYRVLWGIYAKKRAKTRFFYAVVPGFEPGQTEPKPVVLPLHHTTIALSPLFPRACKYRDYFPYSAMSR